MEKKIKVVELINKYNLIDNYKKVPGNQNIKCIEEMLELGNEIFQANKGKRTDNLESEIADVLITVNAFIARHNIDIDKVNSEIEFKLKKFDDLIKNVKPVERIEFSKHLSDEVLTSFYNIMNNGASIYIGSTYGVPYFAERDFRINDYMYRVYSIDHDEMLEHSVYEDWKTLLDGIEAVRAHIDYINKNPQIFVASLYDYDGGKKNGF